MKQAAAKKRDATNDHLLPLSAAAIAVLHTARGLAGASPDVLIFPAVVGVDAPIGESAIGRLYVRAGYAGRHVPHGWRASFSTILNERFPDKRSAIDQALGHRLSSGDATRLGINAEVEAAYNRSCYLAERLALYERWASLLAYEELGGLNGR